MQWLLFRLLLSDHDELYVCRETARFYKCLQVSQTLRNRHTEPDHFVKVSLMKLAEREANFPRESLQPVVYAAICRLATIGPHLVHAGQAAAARRGYHLENTAVLLVLANSVGSSLSYIKMIHKHDIVQSFPWFLFKIIILLHIFIDSICIHSSDCSHHSAH